MACQPHTCFEVLSSSPAAQTRPMRPRAFRAGLQSCGNITRGRYARPLIFNKAYPRANARLSHDGTEFAAGGAA